MWNFFPRHPAAYGMELSCRGKALTMLHRHGSVSHSTGCPGPLMGFRPRPRPRRADRSRVGL